jgi:hypothetical protein
VLEALYAFVIGAVCMAIVLKTDRFFKLSFHQGIRYFRNAFFFYGVAFLLRYLFGVLVDMDFTYLGLFQILFEYFLIMAGFFLLYSLVWKKFEPSRFHYTTSFFNPKIAIFHIMALILAVLDSSWQTYYFMFLSQIIIFISASLISYNNYRKNGKKHKFLKFSFFAMVLGLTAWIMNFLAEAYLQWNHDVLIGVGITNVVFFIIFLYGVIKITNDRTKVQHK